MAEEIARYAGERGVEVALIHDRRLEGIRLVYPPLLATTPGHAKAIIDLVARKSGAHGDSVGGGGHASKCGGGWEDPGEVQG